MKPLTAALPQLLCLITLSCPLLFGQTPVQDSATPPTSVVVPGLKTPAQAGAPAGLSSSLKRDIVPGRRLTIVTQDKPLFRQDCKVEKYDEHELVCRGKSAPVSYHEEDLVAVIGQDREFGLPKPLRLLSTLGLGGGALAGAALLASIPTAGIPLAVVGGILLLDSIFEAMDSAGTGPRERLIYLNPDQRLQIDLK